MDSTEPRVVGVSGVFTRASSGLVRQVSTSDTIYYGAMAITIVFFPFTHRGALERSPSNIRVGRVPLMTICGVLAIPFLAFIAYRTATDKALGANAHISLIVNGVLIAIGLGWFYALRWFRRSRGEDMHRRFKEIPIE